MSPFGNKGTAGSETVIHIDPPVHSSLLTKVIMYIMSSVVYW